MCVRLQFSSLDHSYPVGKMHINVLSELCPVSEPWKTPEKYNLEVTRLFVLDANFSQGNIKHIAISNTIERDNIVLKSKEVWFCC